jgi:hypothetical protein
MKTETLSIHLEGVFCWIKAKKESFPLFFGQNSTDNLSKG